MQKYIFLVKGSIAFIKFSIGPHLPLKKEQLRTLFYTKEAIQLTGPRETFSEIKLLGERHLSSSGAPGNICTAVQETPDGPGASSITPHHIEHSSKLRKALVPGKCHFWARSCGGRLMLEQSIRVGEDSAELQQEATRAPEHRARGVSGERPPRAAPDSSSQRAQTWKPAHKGHSAF